MILMMREKGKESTDAIKTVLRFCKATQYMDMAPMGDMERKAQKSIKDIK